MIEKKLIEIFERNKLNIKGKLKLDSLKFTQLIIDLENNFKIQFNDDDLIFENFNSLDKIKKIVDNSVINKYKKYLYKDVFVKIDRKLGDLHPEFNYIYPLNYGYIPNTTSEDNEEIDVYVLGVFSPVLEFTGICKGIVQRYNDEENKLIVMPKGKEYSVEQMEALVEFQEQFFKHKIIVK
jgi:inorganic diphosphatase